jgi:hypothetical protein
MTSSSDSRLISSPPFSSRRLPVARKSAFPAARSSSPFAFSFDPVQDLAIRVEWLEQALTGVPSSWALAQLLGWTQGLRDLHRTIVRVQAHARDPLFGRVFNSDGALAAFLGRLFEWCGDIIREFEGIAGKLRRQQPALAVFSFKVVSESYVRFQRLEVGLRAAIAELRPSIHDVHAEWATFESDFEEMLWATEWLHMSLAARPGG